MLRKKNPLDAAFTTELTSLPYTRAGFAARFIGALHARQRVWIIELEPIRRVWIADTLGVVQHGTGH